MSKNVLEALQQQDKRLMRIEKLLSTQKKVLNLDEVSQLTGLSKSHLYKLTSWGMIPHYKQSKHLYFDRDEVNNWLKANKGNSNEDRENEIAHSLNIRQKGGEK